MPQSKMGCVPTTFPDPFVISDFPCFFLVNRIGAGMTALPSTAANPIPFRFAGDTDRVFRENLVLESLYIEQSIINSSSKSISSDLH